MKLFFLILLISCMTCFGDDIKKISLENVSQEIASLKRTELVRRQKLIDTKCEINRLKFKTILMNEKDIVEKMFADLKVYKPLKKRKLLIFARATSDWREDWRHDSTEAALMMFRMIAEKTGAFSLVYSEDEKMMTESELAKFDGLMLLNSTINPIGSKEARSAFEKYLENKKGLIGIHAGIDAHWNWPSFKEALGGSAMGTPWQHNSKVVIYNEGLEHPLSDMVPQGYTLKEEIYQFKENSHFSREKARVLLSLDMTHKNNFRGNAKRKDNDYAVSWIKDYRGSRVFYTSFGNEMESFVNPIVVQHMLSGIQYALGDVQVDSTPSAKLGKLPKTK